MSLPPRALALATEWARIHQAELQAEWARARERQPLLPISPLECGTLVWGTGDVDIAPEALYEMATGKTISYNQQKTAV